MAFFDDLKKKATPFINQGKEKVRGVVETYLPKKYSPPTLTEFMGSRLMSKEPRTINQVLTQASKSAEFISKRYDEEKTERKNTVTRGVGTAITVGSIVAVPFTGGSSLAVAGALAGAGIGAGVTLFPEKARDLASFTLHNPQKAIAAAGAVVPSYLAVRALGPTIAAAEDVIDDEVEIKLDESKYEKLQEEARKREEKIIDQMEKAQEKLYKAQEKANEKQAEKYEKIIEELEKKLQSPSVASKPPVTSTPKKKKKKKKAKKKTIKRKASKKKKRKKK